MDLRSRHLVVSDNQIVLAPSAQVAGSTLCDFCSLRGDFCNEPVRQSCVEFTPAVGFVPPILGIEGVFSTFRASSVWYSRARAVFQTHRRLGLYNSATGERIKIGTITGAFRGPFVSLMEQHAKSNHLVQAAKIPASEAPTWLPRKIRNLAGSRYVKRPDQICSVIYASVKKPPTISTPQENPDG